MRLLPGILLLGCGFVISAVAQTPTVTVTTDYLMTLEAPLDPAFQAVGGRLIVNVPAGGTVQDQRSTAHSSHLRAIG